jgi:hypothetical protein
MKLSGISDGICHKILSYDLNMSRVTQQNVPQVLAQDNHVGTCRDLIYSANEDGTFLNRIVTEDEM